MQLRRAVIAGSGSYLPEGVISNQDLQQLVDTNDSWITERTGIRERRKAGPGETTASMSAIAARRACERAGVDPADVDLVIVATITPDHLTPSTACLVQDQIGAKRAGAFDISAACSGFVYALSVGSGMIAAGSHQRVLVIGAETLTRFTDYTDRGTCILFGDGAGAVLLTAGDGERGMLYSRLSADGSGAPMLLIPAGGSKSPSTCNTVTDRQHYLQVEGRKVFKFATNAFVDLVEDAVRGCGATKDEVSLVVPHQVNQRIIEAAVDRLGMPLSRFYVNIDRYGNTSAASVPIALDEALRNGRLKTGDLALFVAFGAGLTWASVAMRM